MSSAPNETPLPRAPRGNGGPPPGSPWDLPFEDAPLAFIDLEMTGLDAANDRVIEICIERFRGGALEDRLETLIFPGPGVIGNVRIHGIDEDALRDAPSFAQMEARVRALLEGAILVAHAAAWDVAFLEAEFRRAGRTERFPFFLDTLMLSRRAFVLPSHALSALAVALGIAAERPHRAGDDVRVLREIFARIVVALTPATARDLWYVRVGERRARPEIVSACLHAWEAKTPVCLTYRPSRKAPQTAEVIVTGVRTDLDPPRVMGYALSSRGRFDYRADRILSVLALPGQKSDTRTT